MSKLNYLRTAVKNAVSSTYQNRILYSSGSALVGSANLTYDGTSLSYSGSFLTSGSITATGSAATFSYEGAINATGSNIFLSGTTLNEVAGTTVNLVGTNIRATGSLDLTSSAGTATLVYGGAVAITGSNVYISGTTALDLSSTTVTLNGAAVISNNLTLSRQAVGNLGTASLDGVIIGVSANPADIELPDVVASTGRTYIVMDEVGGAGANNITVNGSGSNVNGGTYTIAANYGGAVLYSDGSNWYAF